jgi:hypothetical protein
MGVEVGAVVDEELDDIRKPFVASADERGATIMIGGIDVSVACDEELSDI